MPSAARCSGQALNATVRRLHRLDEFDSFLSSEQFKTIGDASEDECVAIWGLVSTLAYVWQKISMDDEVWFYTNNNFPSGAVL